MSNWIKILAVAVVAVVLVSTPAFAQQGGTDAVVAGNQGFNIYFGAAVGAGIVMIAAGFGISRIGSAAVESMARQPEVAGNIQTAMIIAAALIEGATFFALIVCMMSIPG